MYYVYILQNPQGRFYICQTQNIQERLMRHQQGRSPYTRHHGPWSLFYSETYPDRSSAIKREHQLKSQKNTKFLTDLIASQTAG